jgi:hypothetical protein
LSAVKVGARRASASACVVASPPSAMSAINQSIGDLLALGTDDLVRQLAHPQIVDVSVLAGEDGDRVVRDHALHVLAVVDEEL